MLTGGYAQEALNTKESSVSGKGRRALAACKRLGRELARGGDQTLGIGQTRKAHPSGRLGLGDQDG
eukprot:5387822-Pleurochrysis_carterae.AAC.2